MALKINSYTCLMSSFLYFYSKQQEGFRKTAQPKTTKEDLMPCNNYMQNWLKKNQFKNCSIYGISQIKHEKEKMF